MIAEYYQQLTLDERANILWDKGTYLDEVIDYGKHRVSIYELYDFFVGVFYSVKDNRIEKIEVLETNMKEKFMTISPN